MGARFGGRAAHTALEIGRRLGCAMRMLRDPRFLGAYAGVVTAALALVVLTGFGGRDRALRLDTLTVERINVVEPDGTLRLVISDKARVPGIYLNNMEHLAGLRTTAGLFFLDDEGTENGGLTFSGSRDADGTAHSTGHLGFDDYLQDQVLSLDASRDGADRSQSLTLIDRPSWPITEQIALLERVLQLPPDQRQAAIAAFNASHASAVPRLRLAREDDGEVALRLKDADGRDRAVLHVTPDGAPELQLLGADGAVLARLPQ